MHQSSSSTSPTTNTLRLPLSSSSSPKVLFRKFLSRSIDLFDHTRQNKEVSRIPHNTPRLTNDDVTTPRFIIPFTRLSSFVFSRSPNLRLLLFMPALGSGVQILCRLFLRPSLRRFRNDVVLDKLLFFLFSCASSSPLSLSLSLFKVLPSHGVTVSLSHELLLCGGLQIDGSNMMDFGAVGLEGLGDPENGVVPHPEAATKCQSNGSAFLKQARSGSGEDDWRNSIVASAPKKMLHQQGTPLLLRSNSVLSGDGAGQHQNMLSFSSPISEVNFLNKNGGFAERTNQS